MQSIPALKKPKTRKGKKILEKRGGQLVEDDKRAMFMKGSTVNQTMVDFMKDIALLKKPLSSMLNQKNESKPFENADPIEHVAQKGDFSLFMFGSNSKKRPNNLVIGRLFDNRILDMFEFGVSNYKALRDFKAASILKGCKPILLFSGEPFETEFEYQRLKNLLIDFFSGPKTNAIRLTGLEHVISIVAAEGKIYFRSYRVLLKKTGAKLPRVELQEMGPFFDLTLRRHKLASDSLMKSASKQPKQLKPRKVKNIQKSALGTTFGRVHMQRQDYSELQVRKLKGLKKSKSEKREAESDEKPAKKVRFSIKPNP
ncbi:ribosomal biogenesis protein-like protein [Dinothrombium tinctorium]|uniref:Ribosome production factor 2 homolog n=1 Tax=Dinothrombium tinctorium TaxID=1965070 RepID=A0A3S3PQ76_9ACAR|nr:ribosomal biogenesis protein-like protein [Dinothrombium tinctorium]RWS14334.1 ribosomal biogenesis protein-like protein [Dinothrombium tinctorium]RWS14361.1 ribosomal biogenesis protein-like protein [Dinothrombium tinctorium]RWS14939.1 ribosomal biogenesis protein-like protein [Dinothrombium tinctorium]